MILRCSPARYNKFHRAWEKLGGVAMFICITPSAFCVAIFQNAADERAISAASAALILQICYLSLFSTLVQVCYSKPEKYRRNTYIQFARIFSRGGAGKLPTGGSIRLYARLSVFARENIIADDTRSAKQFISIYFPLSLIVAFRLVVPEGVEPSTNRL